LTIDHNQGLTHQVFLKRAMEPLLLIGLVADGRTLSSLFEPTPPWATALRLIFDTENYIRNFRDQKRRLNSWRYANERII